MKKRRKPNDKYVEFRTENNETLRVWGNFDDLFNPEKDQTVKIIKWLKKYKFKHLAKALVSVQK